jgi:hypothetical protein
MANTGDLESASTELLALVGAGESPSDVASRLSRRYKVNESSLLTRYYRSRKQLVIPLDLFKVHSNAKLTEMELAVFDTTTRLFAGMDLGWTRVQAVAFIKRHMKKDVSVKWVTRRWRKTGQPMAKPKSLSKKRTVPSVAAGVESFAEQLAKCWETAPPPAHCVVNVDEARIVMEGGNLKVKRAVHPDKKASLRVPYGDTVCSLISFVAASGECLMHLVVLKSKTKVAGKASQFKIKFEPYGKRGNVPVLYAQTETGFVDQECFKSAMRTFADYWDNILGRKGLACYVFSDQLTLHRQAELVEDMAKRLMYMWSLPANTSHITQPLDDVLFAVFKQLWYAKSHEALRERAGRPGAALRREAGQTPARVELARLNARRAARHAGRHVHQGADPQVVRQHEAVPVRPEHVRRPHHQALDRRQQGRPVRRDVGGAAGGRCGAHGGGPRRH